MTRDDLFNINAGIVRDIAVAIAEYCPTAFVCVISNPVNSTVSLSLDKTFSNNIDFHINTINLGLNFRFPFVLKFSKLLVVLTLKGIFFFLSIDELFCVYIYSTSIAHSECNNLIWFDCALSSLLNQSFLIRTDFFYFYLFLFGKIIWSYYT